MLVSLRMTANLSPLRRLMTKRKRKVSCPKLPMQRQLPIAHEGRFFDLKAIFDKLNAKYFRNRLKDYNILWGRKRRFKPQNEIVFGTIQEDDRLIRIHPLLDRSIVPAWFVEYVIYHEMCHAVVRDEYDSAGRRIVHHEKFYARERRFHWFRRAKAWEEQNLGRFLR